MRLPRPGKLAVVAYTPPSAPPSKRSAAETVSSASIGCASVAAKAFTSVTGGMSAVSQSTMWIAWFMSAPPPSMSRVPCQSEPV